MSVNPCVHFEIAPHGGGALEFLSGKNDAVMLRAAAADEGIGAKNHVVQDGYESWISRKVVQVEGAGGEMQTVECDGLRVACSEEERKDITEYLASVGFWVFAPDDQRSLRPRLQLFLRVWWHAATACGGGAGVSECAV